jgi:antimicrobial peptide system SdpB family protein
VLFRPLGVEIVSEVRDIPLLRLSLFTILPGERLEAARWLAIVILAAVISGWRPRITGILHWWVTASFAVSCVIVEGGDQAAAILTLLLVPVTLTDPRRSHWSAPADAIAGPGRAIAASVAVSALNVVRLQMAVIYFFACTAKLGVAEWSNGTAAYYWFLHPIFGVEGWRRALLMPALTGPVGVTLLTWGSVALEALLFMGLLMERRWRPWLFAAGVLFHCGIAVIHGLPTFGMVMIAGLILYLLPHERPLTLEPLQRAPTVCTDAGCGRIGSPQVAR